MHIESIEKIRDKSYKIGVIGLGYVGLPLLLSFFKKGFSVIGFDIDIEKVKKLDSGESYIKHISETEIKELSASGKAAFTTDYKRVEELDAIILCVPTPLNAQRTPNMQFVIDTAESVSVHLKENQLISLESTTWPGTTDELLIPILEKGSGLKAGDDFFVVYSPEREDPGNPDYDTSNIPKIIGGTTSEASILGEALYSAAIERIVTVSNAKIAEAAKLHENIFRSVNIAMVNEMKIILDSMDIDIHEVIDAASTKPFGFMKFTPGPGLGGHCIPIDPFYLSWKASEFGLNTRFIELAGEINTQMPDYVIGKLMKALNFNKKSINGSNILIIGIAYKPDVDDMRESPAFPIMDQISSLGGEVDYFDEWIPVIPKTREHKSWMGKSSIEWEESKIKSYDAVVIVTDHSHIDFAQLGNWSKCIIDSRNAMKGYSSKKENYIFKA